MKALRLDSPTARKPLATRDPPYYVNVAKSIAIGYRKGVAQSTWSIRRFNGTKYHRREIGQADDAGFEADGVTVFSWTDVVKIAIGEPARDVAFKAKYSVKQCVADYFTSRRARSRSPESLAVDSYKTKSFLDRFGDEQVSRLTMAELQTWRDGLVSLPPADAELDDAERRALQRAAQATANRVWSTVRAALNHAFNTQRVESDIAWRRIKPFHGVDEARTRFLSVAECNALLGASPPLFRDLAQAGLMTGLRPGELVRLDVSSFDLTRIAVGAAKTATGRHVPLTKEGQSFFKRLVKGRDRGSILLPNPEGERWTRMQIARAMREAVKAAGLKTPAVFYDLRRSYASLLANAGAADATIANALGHTDTRMVRLHYGHLLASTIAAELQAKLPKFKAKLSSKKGTRGRNSTNAEAEKRVD